MEKFFEKICFKYIQPNEEKKGIKKIKYKIYKKIKKTFFNRSDILNIDISKLEKEDVDFLNQICKIQDSAHMGTPATALLINNICRKLNKDQVFLNIGAYRGFSTVSGMIKTSCEVHSVDNFSEFDGPEKIFLKNFNMFKKHNHFFYKKDYEEFFKQWNKKINFYIYDAHHSYEQQYKNLEIARNFFDKSCLVYIDDYNQKSVIDGTKDFLAKYKNEFKIIKEQYTGYNVHPTYWDGFILFKKIK